MKSHRNCPSFKTRVKFMFCLKYLSNHQWSPWKQLFSGSWRNYVQEQRLAVLITPLKTTGGKYSVVRNVPVCTGVWSSVSLHLCSFTCFGLSRAQGSRCKISFHYMIYINPEFLPERVTNGSMLHTKRKTCPVECAPAKPAAAGRATWPLPSWLQQAPGSAWSQMCRAFSL